MQPAGSDGRAGGERRLARTLRLSSEGGLADGLANPVSLLTQSQMLYVRIPGWEDRFPP
jgi:hypothetical protein